jgi:hypothetical protein
MTGRSLANIWSTDARHASLPSNMCRWSPTANRVTRQRLSHDRMHLCMTGLTRAESGPHSPVLTKQMTEHAISHDRMLYNVESNRVDFYTERSKMSVFAIWRVRLMVIGLRLESGPLCPRAPCLRQHMSPLTWCTLRVRSWTPLGSGHKDWSRASLCTTDRTRWYVVRCNV